MTKTIDARDFRGGDRVKWPNGFVSSIFEATEVDFGVVWIHEWEPTLGGPSRVPLPPTMPFERVAEYVHPLRPHAPNAKPARRGKGFPCDVPPRDPGMGDARFSG